MIPCADSKLELEIGYLVFMFCTKELLEMRTLLQPLHQVGWAIGPHGQESLNGSMSSDGLLCAEDFWFSSAAINRHHCAIRMMWLLNTMPVT